MNGRERVMAILDGKEVDRSAYWMGNPTTEAFKIYRGKNHFMTKQQLGANMGDDLSWIPIECYHHPSKRPAIDVLGGAERHTLSQNGVFYNAKSADEIRNYKYWPDMNYMSVADRDIKQLVWARKRGLATFSGGWAPIWHHLADYFGMEECFMRMFDDPDQIYACMDKMTEYYLANNKMLFEKCGELIDVMFFGNDMGSQLDCLISPDMYREFIFPYYKKLIDQAKSYGKKVALHSCGAIDKIIPDIINMGVDILHPIQAKAVGMDAEHLQAQYGGQIIFMGGIDTQELLPFGTVEQVEAEVIRLRKLFGKNYICSPSHEALLDNVSKEKLVAMSSKATELL